MRTWIWVLGACLWGCDDGAEGPARDAAVDRGADAGRPDGAIDSGTADATPRDATAADARADDARPADAQAVDAAADMRPPDAATPDAGPCGGCPEGTRCLDGECRQGPRAIPCGPDGACPEGRVCDAEDTCVVAPECDCPISWFQACGVDGRTYVNECEAGCRGVEVARLGSCLACARDVECPAGFRCVEGECALCDCSAEFELVCGTDGRTYGSRCDAACGQVGIAHVDPCLEACPDPGNPRVRFLSRDEDWCRPLDVVCPPGGAPFNNACGCGCVFPEAPCVGADCPAGADCAGNEECPPGQVCGEQSCARCSCPDAGPLVCGVDGLTYPSACAAECSRVAVAHAGACPRRCRDDVACGVGNICVDSVCEQCGCEPVRELVCGSDVTTHLNLCEARCAHVEFDHFGSCAERCADDAGCPEGVPCVMGRCRGPG